jgi:alpha-galactosidase
MNPSTATALAQTPPMGWNSWNTFGPRVNEDVVRQSADALVSSGLTACGYNYLVIDDCWSVKAGRDGNGDLVPDPERFPNGIKPLADYAHSLGLKFGIYSDAAEMTCAGYPGSYGFEDQDARLWASWGVDFLKYDYCHAPADQATAIDRYTRMGDALRRTGRPILFSLCEWGGRNPSLWGRQAGGQMWRVTGDVVDSWADVWTPEFNWWGLGIDRAIDVAVNLAPYAGPGGWNDMDMLVIGVGGKGHIPGRGANLLEYRTQMAMWSILCSPLMAGCDIRSLDADSAALLMNREVLAVNQDALGKQAVRVRQQGPLEVWVKPLADGSRAAALLNRGSGGADITVTAADLGLLDGQGGVVRDLWQGADVADFKQAFTTRVLPHDTVLVRVTAGI